MTVRKPQAARIMNGESLAWPASETLLVAGQESPAFQTRKLKMPTLIALLP